MEVEPRKQFSLAELVARLRPLESRGLNAESTVFNDLQTSILIAEVRFPRYRDGWTAVPRQHWEGLEFRHFTSNKDDEFYLPVSIFAAAERERLKITTLAVCNGDVKAIDEEYRQHFSDQGWLTGTSINRDELIDFCFWAQHELTKAETNDTELQVWVQKESLHGYVRDIEARLTPPTQEETRVENWHKIYQEIIRRILRDPTALGQNKVAGFVRDVSKWAIESYGTTHVPGEDRIRQVVDDAIRPIQAFLKSNKG